MSPSAWDIVPAYWTNRDEFLDKEGWKKTEVGKFSNIEECYDHVIEEFDLFLSKYGYVREGRHYRVEKESDITIVCVCHLGIIGVLLSHFWNISPFILWNSFFLAPTSVSEVVTEERQQGIAYFRATKLGDTSHLIIDGEEASSAGKFCEMYSH